MQEDIKTKNFIKRDLIKVLILILVFWGVLVGLKIIDNKSGYITELAGKITSFFIK